jgi:hypothetical protein
MGAVDHGSELEVLRAAYDRGDLVLYLGAGVSVGSELPTWEHLVAAMYFRALTTDSSHREITRAYPNYLLGIAKWYLDQRRSAMDISARKIRAFYERENKKREFIVDLRSTLYTAMLDPGGYPAYDSPAMLDRNRTLQAIAELCARSEPGKKGVRAIVTYNYDNLLEMATETRVDAMPVWKATTRIRAGRLPIYHVHGYVPLDGAGSTPNELIFSEEQFNEAANDPYHWSNVVQLQHMSGSVGLTIGLSLTDRNMRRLLDVARSTPLPPRMYAVVRPTPPPPFTKTDNNRIRKLAEAYRKSFAEAARMKIPNREFDQVSEILAAVHVEDQWIEEYVLKSFGVTTLAIDDFDEIADVIVPAIIDGV